MTEEEQRYEVNYLEFKDFHMVDGSVITEIKQGKDVERIQRALKITADGVYGKLTANGVKVYQK